MDGGKGKGRKGDRGGMKREEGGWNSLKMDGHGGLWCCRSRSAS